MEVTKQVLNELVGGVFDSVDLSPPPVRSLRAQRDTEPGGLVACVEISGAWDGAIVIQCDARMAASLAGAMLEMEPDELEHDDVFDALGEIANILGGQVKAVYPGPSNLSLPTVVDDPQRTFSVRNSSAVASVVLSGDLGWLEASVVERAEEEADAEREAS